MVRRHHEQRVVLAARKRPMRRGGDRGRSVAGYGLEEDRFRRDADRFELIDNERALLLACGNERRKEGFAPAPPGGGLEQRLVTEDALELLRVSAPRQRPQ